MINCVATEQNLKIKEIKNNFEIEKIILDKKGGVCYYKRAPPTGGAKVCPESEKNVEKSEKSS